MISKQLRVSQVSQTAAKSKGREAEKSEEREPQTTNAESEERAETTNFSVLNWGCLENTVLS